MVCNFIKKEALAQVFSCEFYEIFNDTFFYGTPLVAASDPLSIMMLQRMVSLKIQKQHYWDQFSNNVCGKLKLLRTLKMIWKLICFCKINWKLLKAKTKVHDRQSSHGFIQSVSSYSTQAIYCETFTSKKKLCPLRISIVNINKSAVYCRFVHIY